MSSVVRVPVDVHKEITRVAAFRGEQPGHLIAQAWREFFEKHRTEFAADLDRAAQLLRNGTLDELAAFTSRSASTRADRAAARLAGERIDD